MATAPSFWSISDQIKRRLQLTTQYLVRDIKRPNHQFTNLRFFLTKYLFTYLLFSAKFLYWKQPTFSKSWRYLKMHFTASKTITYSSKTYSWFSENKLMVWCHEQHTNQDMIATHNSNFWNHHSLIFPQFISELFLQEIHAVAADCRVLNYA